MTMRQTVEIFELLDSPAASGAAVCDLLRERGPVEATFQRVEGARGHTDFVTIRIPGTAGKSAGGSARTLGIIGRLGGIGARPEMIGMVSDADGAIAALAAALKLTEMAARGDRLPGDVVITTHICPNAPTRPHHPVPFMGSPVDSAVANDHEVTPDMDAALSIDTTRGNRILNARGIAITPTVKEGYILRVSDGLLDVLGWVTGRLPLVLPITTQDITPYGNGLYHINSIMQPCVTTAIPVVGVALTAEVPVPGCATGASQPADIEVAARFAVEVAKQFGAGVVDFHDAAEWERIQSLYGSMKHLQRGALPDA
ncbi:MAG: DUF1177 domain-containing protein [Bacillota bacterium]